MVGHGDVMAATDSADNSNGPSVPQRLLTLKEVSDMLRVHPNSIRRWSDAGLLPAVRLGERGDRRFRVRDVERFLEGHLPKPPSKRARSGKSPRRQT